MDPIDRQMAIDAVVAWTVEDRPDIEMPTDLVGRIESLPPAQPEQQWIPCSERLPEEGIVLVTYRDRDIDILRYPTAYRQYDIIAWMPIEAWRGEEHEL